MKKIIRWIIAFVFASPVASMSADVEIVEIGETPVIDLVGTIDRRTPDQLKKAIAQVSRGNPAVIALRLDSGGGDLDAAIRAGYLVRQRDMMTAIPKDAVCASACTMLYLAGVSRFAFGRFGIHRPYTTRLSDSETDARLSFETSNKLIQGYLQKMNIPQRLLDMMISVSPGEVRWLTAAELKDLGIEGMDPLYEDRISSANARRMGISKQEYYSREQRAAVLCSSTPLKSNEDALRRLECNRLVMEGKLK